MQSSRHMHKVIGKKKLNSSSLFLPSYSSALRLGWRSSNMSCTATFISWQRSRWTRCSCNFDWPVAVLVSSVHLTVPPFLNPHQDNIFTIKWYELCPRLHMITSSESVGFHSHNRANAEAEQHLILQNNIAILAIVQSAVTAFNHHLLAKDRLKNSTKERKYGITKISRKQS